MKTYIVGPFELRTSHDLQYATRRSAGFDLPAYLPDGPVTLPAGSVMRVPTGVSIDRCAESFNVNYELQVRPRSGLSSRGIAAQLGTVDADYLQKDIGVILYNFTKYDYQIANGDRIAQIVCNRIETNGTIPKADKTRTGGFGHTGS